MRSTSRLVKENILPFIKPNTVSVRKKVACVHFESLMIIGLTKEDSHNINQSQSRPQEVNSSCSNKNEKEIKQHLRYYQQLNKSRHFMNII